MIIISCENIKLSFGVEMLLDGVSFALNEGDKLGIVGVNGAGKTSLFRIISGEYKPDSGDIYISKDKTIGMLGQSLNFVSDNTLLSEMTGIFFELIAMQAELEKMREEIDGGNIALSARYADLHDKFTREGGFEYLGRCKGMLKRLGFSEQFWDLKINSLSGGQKTRVALARLLLCEPDILMLDEPTNHLDIDTLFWLEEYLKSYRKTVIVISHDRYFLDNVTNKILEIEYKKGILYKGNYTSYKNQKESNREIQQKHYELQQREIERIEKMIEQQRRWGQERNFITIKSKEKQLEKIERIEKPKDDPEGIKFKFNSSGESGNDVLIIKNLSKGYPGKPLFFDLNILIKKYDHVFIFGNNGCGKSTLLKIITGMTECDAGTIELGYNVKIGYYDQENQELDDEKLVIDELWDTYDKMTQTQIRKALALFNFKGDDILKKVGVLSGGEKARLTLTKLILSSMNLLILDEPTNHLDINSREVLEKALLEFEGTIIAVSHDRYFINKLSTRILAFNAQNENEIYDYRGTFEEYIKYKNNYLSKESSESDERGETETKKKFIETKRSLSEQRKYERKLRLTREEIGLSEEELTRINEEINGEAAADHIRLTDLFNREEKLEERLLVLYAELEELEKQDISTQV